jgi:TonB family protein
MSISILRTALPMAVCAATIPLSAQAPAGARDSVYDLDQVQVRPAPLNASALAAALRTTYPPHLEEAGLGGAVVVSMVIGADGQPRDARLVSSTDTAFDAPSLAMVSLLRFSPAQVDGRAVGVRLELPINWEPGARPAEAPGQDSTGAYGLREVEEMPRILNRDVFARALSREYPPHLRDAGFTGTVHVRFLVEMDGSISQPTIIRSSQVQFNDATLRAIQALRFRPGKIDQAPVRVWVVLPIRWEISRGGFGDAMPEYGPTPSLGCPVNAMGRC